MAETLPVQEPVAHYDFQKRKLNWAVNVVITSAPVSIKIEPMPLYAAPLQRPWVGLTDEDMNDRRTQNFDFIYGARWAEAKLKERNT